jgi:hypothetical protein
LVPRIGVPRAAFSRFVQEMMRGRATPSPVVVLRGSNLCL